MKAIPCDGSVTLVMTAEEAKHIGLRLGCSSFESFDNYRQKNKLSNLHRHPLAEDYAEALEEAEVE